MRAMIGLCLASLIPVAMADDPVRHEPIHPPDRVFTADEFRQDLVLRRAQEAIADYLSKNKPAPEQLESMRRLAQSIKEGADHADAKPPLSLPPDLLNNPQIQKLLTNEALLKRVLENKQLLELAQRIASRIKPPTPSRSTDLPGGRELAPPGTRQDGTGPQSTTGERRDDREGERESRAKPPTDRPPAKSDQSEEPFEREQAEGSRSGPNETKPVTPPTEDTRFKGLAEKLRRLGPMHDSETLSRLEQMVDGSVSPSAVGTRGSRSSAQQIENWLSQSWIGNVDGFKPENIPLPPGLKDWRPALPDIPLPNLSRLPTNFPTMSMPSMKSLSVPDVRSISLRSLVWPMGFAGTFLLIIVLVRLGLVRWPERWRLESSPWKVKPPVRRLDPTSRSSVQEWFEYLAFLRYGPTARGWSHRRIAGQLGQIAPAPAERVSQLYEQARYRPPSDPLDSPLSDRFADDIASLRNRPTDSH